MNLYIVGITILVIVIIGCIGLYIYFLLDEKKLKEVTTEQLKKYGKEYTKEEFENKMFEMYSIILADSEYAHYEELRDSVSDEEYNKILLKMKMERDNNVIEVTKDIHKEICKLIGFTIKNGLEIAKVWVKYSAIEYTQGMRTQVDEEGNEIQVAAILSGSDKSRVSHEYILTFVKNHADNEDVVCPNCGYKVNMLTRSKCMRCDSIMVPKKMHWVFVDKVVTNISKA